MRDRIQRPTKAGLGTLLWLLAYIVYPVSGAQGDQDREQGPWIFCDFLLGS